MTNPHLTWLGATCGLMGPGWQAGFRLEAAGETHTVVAWLGQPETDAIAAHLGQTKLEKRQAELILQHAGRELIEAALEAFEVPEAVHISTQDATRTADLKRWHLVT